MRQAKELEIPTEQAETCYWYARHLAPSNADRARELFAEARRIWEERGMANNLARLAPNENSGFAP